MSALSLTPLILLFGVFAIPAFAQKKGTVCTITVNSPDEKEVFRQHLPKDKWDFVELIEHGRKDWLELACRKNISCDVLVISGHFSREVFYSESEVGKPAISEDLPVRELERVSCSNSCPSLMANLKEVYLFGCNTLKTRNDADDSYDEVVRNLVRAGRSRAQAEQTGRMMSQTFGETNRDRMRRYFVNVPLIYGFHKESPLGPQAAAMLRGALQSRRHTNIGTGRLEPALLQALGNANLTSTSGLTQSEPQFGYRQQACQFYDSRLSLNQKLDFARQVFEGDPNVIRMHLDNLEGLILPLGEHDRHRVVVSPAARQRYLELARNTNNSTHLRMADLARAMGWLTPEQYLGEYARLFLDWLKNNKVSAHKINLICDANQNGQLNSLAEAARSPIEAVADRLENWALLACLNDQNARQHLIESIFKSQDQNSSVQAYFFRRPLNSQAEIASFLNQVLLHPQASVQVYALSALDRAPSLENAALNTILNIYSSSASVEVQLAVIRIMLKVHVALLSAERRNQIFGTLEQFGRADILKSPAYSFLSSRLTGRPHPEQAKNP